MENLPIFCIITAENCGHCKNMRKSSLETTDKQSTIQGGHSWSVEFFKKLLFGVKDIKEIRDSETPSYRVFNYHCGSMRNTSPENAQLTEFIVNGDTVEMVNHMNVQELVPRSIAQFLMMFPTFSIFEPTSWYFDISNNTTTLYGKIMNAKTGSVKIQSKSVYGVIKDGVHSYGVTPDVFAMGNKGQKLVPPPLGPDDASRAPGLNPHQTALETSYREKVKNPRKEGYVTEEDKDLIVTL
jgi:hypothetical protein